MAGGFVSAFVAAMLGAVYCPPPPAALPLQTAGAQIVDANGRRVVLNAVSWYGAESTDFVVGGLDANTLTGIASQIKNLGFNAVRLPWSNQMFENDPVVGSYALTANPEMQGQTAMQIFDQTVSALAAQGLMVILDNHNSTAEWCCSDTDGNTLWENSAYPESSWIADWQGMAQRYANQPFVIGADLRNEPRGSATWGGPAATDWNAAAGRGGNAVLGVNPNLLIFVEGVNYALDLSGAAALPVNLGVPERLVYSAHDYGFDYSGLGGSSDWLSQIGPRWGYLITGAAPQPFWLGEFGTCNTSASCVNSLSSADNGFWFGIITSYLRGQGVSWSYWAVNGTQSTGAGRTFGTPEDYGILSTNWSGSASSDLTGALQQLEPRQADSPRRGDIEPSTIRTPICTEPCACR
jgi:endoglucanase